MSMTLGAVAVRRWLFPDMHRHSTYGNDQIRTFVNWFRGHVGAFEPRLISRMRPDPILELAKTHLPPLHHCLTAHKFCVLHGYAKFNLVVLRSETTPCK
jgi:hypothetical protein